MMGSDGCLERLPYASLMAAVACIIGSVMFATMMIWGFNGSVEQMRRLLYIDEWPWLDRIKIAFVCIEVIMVIATIFLLAVAFAATGSTREAMFRDKKSRVGGKIACTISLILSTLLLAAWLVMLSFTSVLVAGYSYFNLVCPNAAPSISFSDAQCLDMSMARPLVEGFSRASLKICGGSYQEFCALSFNSLAWFIVGWAGAVIVCLGLAQFMVTHSANYIHVSNANRYVELRRVASDSYTSPPIVHPYRGGTGETMQKWAIPPASSLPSTTRNAEFHSDSVSQQHYGYGRSRRKEQFVQ